MLISIELQLHLAVILGLLYFYRLEQILYIVLCQQGTAQNSHYLIYVSVEYKLTLYDCNSAICEVSHINLYPNRISVLPQKDLDAQVFLHPFKEGLYSPSVFIKEGNILGLHKEIVLIVGESPYEFRFIINSVLNDLKK